MQSNIEMLDMLSVYFMCFMMLITVIVKMLLNYKKDNNIKKTLREQAENIKKISAEEDVIALMFDNVKELKEYYVISKEQAKSTFRMAVISCVCGGIIYAMGIIFTVFFDKDISLISVISGTILEMISGTSFLFYNKALKQLNTYHRRLEETEKYLIAHQMISEVPEERRYEEQRNFVNYVLNDNQIRIKNESNKTS